MAKEIISVWSPWKPTEMFSMFLYESPKHDFISCKAINVRYCYEIKLQDDTHASDILFSKGQGYVYGKKEYKVHE